MGNENLLLGIEEAKKGNYEKAAGYLAKVVQADPTNIDGWLFLGHCLPDVEKRRYCYQRVLTISPQNEIAKVSLIRLDSPQKLDLPIPETVSSAIPQETLTPSPVNEQPSQINKPRQSGNYVPLIFGFMLALLLCALPSILLLRSGKFDMYLMGKYLVPGIFAQMTPPASGAPQGQSLDFYMAAAYQSMNNGDYSNAIPYLDSALDLAPQNYMAYAMRAKCYYQLTNQDRSLDLYNQHLQKALADIDMAILFQPAEAELYATRRNIFADMSLVATSQADHEYLQNAAIDNDQKFLSLSPTLDRRLQYSAFLAFDLIHAGQCKEGMQIVADLEKKVQPGNNAIYGTLMTAAADGYACLGDMDKAVQSLDEIMSRSNGYLTTRVYFKSLYLYQAGKTQQALDALNASISSEPTFAGYRYYLRALIDLDMGNKEQAIQDLNMGEKYTWDRTELYAYVKAKLALMDGNQEDAIHWMQIAEASYAPYHPVLHKQILEELSQLGAQPLEKSIGVDFQTTPMPPVTPIP